MDGIDKATDIDEALNEFSLGQFQKREVSGSYGFQVLPTCAL